VRRALLTLALILSALPGTAAEPPPLNREALLGRLRPVYLQATSFSPSAMRYALRMDPAADYRAAHAAAEEAPADLPLRIRAAEAAEAADDAAASTHWQVALGLIEAKLKTDKKNEALLEQQVRAMIGADVATRVVPPAERLAAARPGSWRVQLLLGDAYLRRADFNWRVLVKRSSGTKTASGPELIQMNGDLATCEKAYAKAVELSPAEPAPRGARIGLALARPLMASFLPKGTMAGSPEPDLARIRQDLIDLTRVRVGEIEPLWHALHFFSAQGAREAAIAPEERSNLQKALAVAKAEGDARVFLEEARGMLAAIGQEWDAARAAFESALAAAPTRPFAAEWLGAVESSSQAALADRLARVRKRLEVKPQTQDWTLLGILLAPDDHYGAVDAFRKAIALDVANANARYNLALLILRRNAESREARHHLRRVLEIRPDDREARFAYAVTLALDRLPAEARRTLNAILALSELDLDLRKRAEGMLTDLDQAQPPLASGPKTN
jgi:tetratricopeptide (TPR) repeat protein